jgi:hypothetical protein
MSLGVVFESPVDELTVSLQGVVIVVLESNFNIDSQAVPRGSKFRFALCMGSGEDGGECGRPPTRSERLNVFFGCLYQITVDNDGLLILKDVGCF